MINTTAIVIETSINTQKDTFSLEQCRMDYRSKPVTTGFDVVHLYYAVVMWLHMFISVYISSVYIVSVDLIGKKESSY